MVLAEHIAPAKDPFVHLPDNPNPDKKILGGKGYGLAVMHQLGIPVPAFFTIPTDQCRSFLANPKKEISQELSNEVQSAIKTLEQSSGRTFGDHENPLLVSVRSGAARSMPGMMDTVLNLGLNDETVIGLADQTGDERFALQSYSVLIKGYGEIVLGINEEYFEDKLKNLVQEHGVKSEKDLDTNGYASVVSSFKEIVETFTGESFPQDPMNQLNSAIKAVFNSWNGQRAKDYRQANGIDDNAGTAVNIQSMVFGNLGDNSGTGVLFSRDSFTGEDVPHCDFLPQAQGEEVVSGKHNTLSIEELQQMFPDAYTELINYSKILENHFGDLQDIEFTIERGKLFILQTRSGKRSAEAALKIAVDLVNENLIGIDTSLTRVEPLQMEVLLHDRFKKADKDRAIAEGLLLTKGINASPGSATGEVVFEPEDAVKAKALNKKVILVRSKTEPNDVKGIFSSVGVLTAVGGSSSHAAIVTRGRGIPAVVGANDIVFDDNNSRIFIGAIEIKKGDIISIDGTTGEVFLGPIETEESDVSKNPNFNTFLDWADQIAKLEVWTNADSPLDTDKALGFGARGIGLCRTEHMFFGDRLEPFVKYILSGKENKEEQIALLEKLALMQLGDFTGILRAMKGNPVVIRLLDPPLHEFLPDHDELLNRKVQLEERLAHNKDIVEIEGKDDKSVRLTKKRRAELSKEKEEINRQLASLNMLRESNPMLGLRGVRLGIVRPELYDMQIRSIFEAATTLIRQGEKPRPKIMIPLVIGPEELIIMRQRVEDIATEVSKRTGIVASYEFGTMIETPAAALKAAEIANVVDFISFGTNDLTQMVFGLSRDDVEKELLEEYKNTGILPVNPFQTIDRERVGKLLKMAVDDARAAAAASNKKIEIGVCGEHGGDSDSIAFFNEVGLDYVSSSPHRVPVARLAAAQAVLALKQAA